MDEKYFYAGDWNQHICRARDPLSEDAAKQRHLKRENYSVLVGSPTQPSAVIDFIFDKNCALTSVYDALMRRHKDFGLSYTLTH